MRCPTCGKWNRAHYDRCLQCGGSLRVLSASGIDIKAAPELAAMPGFSVFPDDAADTRTLPVIDQPPPPSMKDISNPDAEARDDSPAGDFDPTSVLAQLMKHRKSAPEAPGGDSPSALSNTSTSSSWFAPKPRAQRLAELEVAGKAAEPIVWEFPQPIVQDVPQDEAPARLEPITLVPDAPRGKPADEAPCDVPEHGGLLGNTGSPTAAAPEEPAHAAAKPHAEQGIPIARDTGIHAPQEGQAVVSHASQDEDFPGDPTVSLHDDDGDDEAPAVSLESCEHAVPDQDLSDSAPYAHSPELRIASDDGVSRTIAPVDEDGAMPEIDEAVLSDARNLMREIRPFAWDRVPAEPEGVTQPAMKPAAAQQRDPVMPRDHTASRKEARHIRPVDAHSIPPLTPKTLSKRRPPAIQKLLVPMLWLIFMIALGYGGYKAYFWIVGMIPPSTQDQRPAAAYDMSLGTPMIETSTFNGEPARTLIFSGNDGDFIFIPEFSSKNHPFVGGQARISIPDSYWIGVDPADDQERIPVELNPKIIRVSGEEKLMAPVEYFVDVPLSPLELIEPSAQNIETNAATQRIQLKVAPGSTVFINEESVSDLVDKNGLVSYNKRVESSGDEFNYIEIFVKTSGCRKNSLQLIIRRPFMDIPINVTNPPESASMASVTIRGETEPGATITVKTEHTNLEHDIRTGIFSFAAKLVRVGVNDVQIVASKEGRQDSQLAFQIAYEPEIGEYSNRAWRFTDEYKNLIANPNARMGQIYKLEGTIIEILKSDLPMLIHFDGGGKSGSSMPVYLEYKGDKLWEKGKTIDVYAHVIGEHEGLPLLEARFIMYY